MLIADLYDSSQGFRRNVRVESKLNKVEACRASKATKIGPIHEDLRPKPRSKGSQNTEFEKRRTGRDRAHHGLPVENTTDHGGGAHGRAPDTHGRAPPRLLAFSSFSCDCSFSFGFLLLSPL